MINTSPLIYSCSGCSAIAQITNHVAIALDRDGDAEMSCITGIGGNVPGIVRAAKFGRALLALDGCSMSCCKCCLTQCELEPDLYVRFDKLGFKKNKGKDFLPEEAERAVDIVKDLIIKNMLINSGIPRN